MSSVSTGSFSLSGTDRTDRVIINLKVLAAIRTGERLTLRNSCFQIQENNAYQGFKRWYNGDDRWGNLSDIKKVVEDAVQILELYLNHDGPTPTQRRFMRTLRAELRGVEGGLQNLKETYSTDKTMHANLDVLLQKIDGVVERRGTEPPEEPSELSERKSSPQLCPPKFQSSSPSPPSSPASSCFSRSPGDVE